MSAKQMVLLTATVMALVVIVTLVKVGLGGRNASDKGPKGDAATNKPHLRVDSPTFPDPESQTRMDPPYAEIGQEGHHDYSFTNDNDAPVEVFLSRKSCSRCVRSVQIGLSAEGWQMGQPVPQPGADVQWVTLESEETKHDAKGFTVPAKSAGWVRLGWYGKEVVAEEWLGANLRTTCATGKAPMIELTVKVRFLEAVRPLKANLALDPIRSGSNKPQLDEFTVYSVTRDHFELKPESEAEQKQRHPFVTCGQPVALTQMECRNLEKVLRLPVRSGYKVPVSVRESARGREIDLGPFTVPLVLKSDALVEDLTLTVTGSVKGIVTVRCDEATDQIALGTFPRSIGTRKKAAIETVGPGANVRITMERVPNFLNVELTEDPMSGDRQKRWTLSVNVVVKVLDDANVSGSLEEALGDTAIYLKANGRRLRVPVTGNVLRQ